MKPITFTPAELDMRSSKVSLISKIYVKEARLGKTKSAFEMLYDNNLEDLVLYDYALDRHIVAAYRKSRECVSGISR